MTTRYNCIQCTSKSGPPDPLKSRCLTTILTHWHIPVVPSAMRSNKLIQLYCRWYRISRVEPLSSFKVCCLNIFICSHSTRYLINNCSLVLDITSHANYFTIHDNQVTRVFTHKTSSYVLVNFQKTFHRLNNNFNKCSQGSRVMLSRWLEQLQQMFSSDWEKVLSTFQTSFFLVIVF